MKTWVKFFGSERKMFAAISAGKLNVTETMVEPITQTAAGSARYALLPCGDTVVAYRGDRAAERLLGASFDVVIAEARRTEIKRMRSFQLSDGDYEILQKIGDGNASAGLRVLIQNFKI